MSFKPLPTRCWQLFLRFMGYEFDRIKASHHQWTKKAFRTIPVWGNEKQIPALHLKTSYTSMGVTMDFLYDWASDNC